MFSLRIRYPTVGVLFAGLALAACSDQSETPVGPMDSPPLQLAADGNDAGVTPDDWIVVFRRDVQDAPGLARQLLAQHGGQLRFTYQHTIRGFAARLPARALEGIRNNPNVDYVEQDGVVTASRAVGSWGLDRIDQLDLPLDGQFNPIGDGSGVRAYIMDTGIRYTHQEFAGGRATFGFDAFGEDGSDCHGHGTHVAGTVGGITYGVAKAVDLVAVRVLGCNGSGSYGGIIAAMDWVTQDHQTRGVPGVANMSLGGGKSTSVNDALNASVAAGVVYAVAAGNENTDACTKTPASASDALTVGSTTSSDSRSSFSNYGTCLDLFAPGSAITSSTDDSDTSTGTWSGTSMATPHVAGVAALYLGANPAATPFQVMDAVLGAATPGLVSGAGIGSPNLLLYSNLAPPPAGPAAPTGLSASASAMDQVDLTWFDNSSGEDGFRIERSGDGVSFQQIATVGADIVGYSDFGRSAGTTYWYRVQSYFDGGGASDYSNVAQATTPGLPVGLSGAPTVVVSSTGKFNEATATVRVVEWPGGAATSTGVAGVTVTGDWYRPGDASPFRSGSGVTGSDGIAVIDSGRRRNTPEMHFCVTGIAGSGMVDQTTGYPVCSDGFTPGDGGGDPGDPPTGGAPSNLSATYSTKGGGRVDLSWTTVGAAGIDVLKGGALIATTSDNGRYTDRDGAAGDTYQVCVTGTDLCSETVTAGG